MRFKHKRSHPLDGLTDQKDKKDKSDKNELIHIDRGVRQRSAARGSGTAGPVLAAVLAAALFGAGRAAASPPERAWPMCRLEAATLQGARLRVLAALTDADGQLVSQPRYSLRLDGQVLRCGLGSCLQERGRFSEQHEQRLELVLLVEESLFLAPLREVLRGALAEFLMALPPRSSVRWGTFGGRVTFAPGARPARELARDLSWYKGPGEVEVRLIEALRAGGRLLAAAPDEGLPPRRVLVVVGSGLDESPLPRRFAALGSELAQADVAVFPVAVLPHGSRLWLLNLSEVAWRTAGTFRWARAAAADAARPPADPPARAPARPLPGAGDADRSTEAAALTLPLRAELLELARELRETEVLWFGGEAVARALLGSPRALTLDCSGSSSAARAVSYGDGRGAGARRRWGVRTLLCVLLCLGLAAALGRRFGARLEGAADRR